jgi:hypothetical protein
MWFGSGAPTHFLSVVDRSRCEVEAEARMMTQPSDHPGVLVSGIVVQDHVDQLAGTPASIALRKWMNS